MISRSGMRISVASSGVTKILRDDGSGPVVTAGFSSAELMGLFMVLLPSGDKFLSVPKSKQAKQRARHDPGRGGNGYEIRPLQHGAAGLHHIGRRGQPNCAADEVGPAEQRDHDASIDGPDIVR